MTTAYFLLGRIPRNSWVPGDARISPLQHASMTSRPKWEELARDGCCEDCLLLLLLVQERSLARFV